LIDTEGLPKFGDNSIDVRHWLFPRKNPPPATPLSFFFYFSCVFSVFFCISRLGCLLCYGLDGKTATHSSVMSPVLKPVCFFALLADIFSLFADSNLVTPIYFVCQSEGCGLPHTRFPPVSFRNAVPPFFLPFPNNNLFANSCMKWESVEKRARSRPRLTEFPPSLASYWPLGAVLCSLYNSGFSLPFFFGGKFGSTVYIDTPSNFTLPNFPFFFSPPPFYSFL